MEEDEWLRMQAEMNNPGGRRMAATTPEPSFDPNESWSELPLLKKISPAAGFELVDVLRQAGIPVRGKPRSAGLFSGGKVNVTLSVPTRLREDAIGIISKHYDSSHFNGL